MIFILRWAIVVGEGSSRLNILSRSPPLSLFDIGVSELDVPLKVCPLRWFFCLLGHGSFHFVPCIPPFLGALVFS